MKSVVSTKRYMVWLLLYVKGRTKKVGKQLAPLEQDSRVFLVLDENHRRTARNDENFHFRRIGVGVTLGDAVLASIISGQLFFPGQACYQLANSLPHQLIGNPRIVADHLMDLA